MRTVAWIDWTATVGARETEIHLRLMRHDDAKEGACAPFWSDAPRCGPVARAALSTTATADFDAGGAQLLDRLGGGLRCYAGGQVEQDPGGEARFGGVGGGRPHAIVSGDTDHVDLVHAALPQPVDSAVSVSSRPQIRCRPRSTDPS